MAPAVRSRSPRGQYKQPIGYVRKCTYPFIVAQGGCKDAGLYMVETHRGKAKVVRVDDPCYALPGISSAYVPRIRYLKFSCFAFACSPFGQDRYDYSNPP